MAEQASCDMQALTVHDRVRGVRMAQVIQPRICHDPGRVARRGPEPVEFVLGQRAVSSTGRKHPLPGSRLAEAIQQLPSRRAEQNVPRSRLGINECESIRLDLTPAQGGVISPGLHPVSRSRRTAATQTGFSLSAQAQGRAELRQIIRAQQPTARWSPVADDPLARVPRSFGPVAPRHGAVEHVAQYLMTAVRAARLSASVFVEEPGNVGTDDRADAEMAESGQDGAVEIAQGRFHRGRLPRRRAPFDVLSGELRQRRAGSGKGHRMAAPLFPRQERERGGPRLVGPHRFGLAARDASRLAVAAEEHPGPRAVRLDPQHEALQGRCRGLRIRVHVAGTRGRGASVKRARSVMVRLPAVEHVGESARHAIRGIEHGALGKVRIAEGGLDVGMAEQSSDHAQTLAPADRDRRVAVSQIVNAEWPQSRDRTDCVPMPCPTSAGPPPGDANTQGQLVRRDRAARMARAGDASQIVRGPVLLSGSTARSPCTCSHLSRNASDLRAPV